MESHWIFLSCISTNTRNYFNLIQPLKRNGKDNAFIGINNYLITHKIGRDSSVGIKI